MAILMSGLVLPTLARAVALRVPEDYSTIQEAVDVAAAGDSVLVGPGTWDQRNRRTVSVCGGPQTKDCVIFLKPGLTVIGTAGPELTILEGGTPSGAPVETVRLTDVSGPTTRVQGFTITGDGEGVEFGCNDSELELRDCHIVNTKVQAMNFAFAKVRLVDCVVSWNEGAGFSSSAVRLGDGTDFEAIRTRFEGNTRGAIAAVDAGRVYLEDCEFVGHSFKRAVSIGRSSDVTVRGCLFLRNSVLPTNSRAGAMEISLSNALVEFCTFAYDSSFGSHVGGLYVANNSSATIRNNTFYRCWNLPGGRGSALGIGSGTAALVHNNIAYGGNSEALAQFSNTTVLPGSGCNLLWGNEADYHNWDPAAQVTDIHEDPEFCDPSALDLSVRDSSPAAALNSGACGQIGAHGVGCGSVSVEPSSWGQIKSHYRTPTATR